MRVVIADDEPTCRMVLRATVERLGHECREASDGQQAWDLLMEEPADVLVTDWMMPGLEGLELCRRLREDPTRAGYTYLPRATAIPRIQSEPSSVRSMVSPSATNATISASDASDAWKRSI